jgi:plasmid stabilization system protein ParE
MTYRIIYSPRSRRDLERIHSYLVAETTDRPLADRTIVLLLEAGDSLKRLPERFARYPYARRWRMMPVGNYLLFFQIHESEVRIGHVRHGAQRPFTD